MTAAAKTAAKKSAAKTRKPATKETTPSAATAAVKPAPQTAKPEPPAAVADYLATLSTDERRYAAKEWRRVTGQRGTAPSLRDIAKERAAAIRQRVAELTG